MVSENFTGLPVEDALFQEVSVKKNIVNTVPSDKRIELAIVFFIKLG
jgi:hypothetical protein